MKTFKGFLEEAPITINNTPMHGSHSKPPIVINVPPMHGDHANVKEISEAGHGGFGDFRPTIDPPDFDKEYPNQNSHLGETHKDVDGALEKEYSNIHQNNSSFSNALKSYTKDSTTINNHLTHNESLLHKYLHPITHSRISALDSQLTSPDTKLKHDLHVYHGTSAFNPDQEASKHPDRKIKMPMFLSTSINPKIAHNFAASGDGHKDGTKRHILHIHLKKGQQGGVYIVRKSKFSNNEYEQLLPRDTTLKVHTLPTVLSDGTHIWHAHLAD